MRRDGKYIINQAISISLVDKMKHQTNGKCIIKNRYVDKKNFGESVAQDNNMLLNRNKNYYDFLVLENFLSPRHRRELRILTCVNYWNLSWNVVDRNPIFCYQNNVKSSGQFLNEEKHLNTEADKFRALRFSFEEYRNFKV